MQRSNIVLGIFFFLFGLILYFWLIPSQVEMGEATDALSPRFFPNMATIGMILLGPLLSFLSWRQTRQLSTSPEQNGKTKKQSNQNGNTDPLNLKNVAYLFLYVGVLSANLFIISIAGFMIGAPLTVISFMLLNGGKTGPIGMVLTAGISTAVIYMMAWGVFEIPLP